MPARVSFYRPTGQSRRTARAPTDHHDVFDGLPIRRWAKQWVPFGKKALAPPPPPELPLPKETHLLTPMSQALLQAARAGTLDKPKQNQNAVQQGQQLFMTNRWCLVPRHLEPAGEPAYLGKLPDVPRRRRRVRRRVEGKVVITYLDEGDMGGQALQQQGGAGAGGGGALQAQPVGAAPTPRRRPPPKRKPGRGRKPGRKVKFAEEAAAAQAPQAGGVGVKKEGEGQGQAQGEGQGQAEPVKVLEVEGGEVEVMELDPASTEGELKPKTEIDVEMERVEMKEEKEALNSLQS